MRSPKFSNAATARISSLSRRNFVRSAGMAAACAAVGLGGKRAFAQATTTTFDFYVSPTGTGSHGQGDINHPWPISMLNDAKARARYSGKRIGFMDGTYNVYSLVQAITTYEQVAIDIDGGTAGSPTVVQAVNARQAIIRADSGGVNYNLNNKGGGMFGHTGTTGHRGYLTIDGLAFTGKDKYAIQIANTGDPITYGITIQNCEVYGISGVRSAAVAIGMGARPAPFGGLNWTPIEFNSTNGALFRNNYVHDNVGAVVGSREHFSAILFWACPNTTIEYCTFTNSAAVYAKEFGSGGLVFRYNYVDAVLANHIDTVAGLDDWVSPPGGGSRPMQIYNNMIRAHRPLTLQDPNDATLRPDYAQQIYNNTILIAQDVATNTYNGPTIESQAGGLSLYNNLIQWDGGAAARRILAVTGEGFGLVDYNLYPGSGSWLKYHAAAGTYDSNSFMSTSAWATWRAAADAHSPAPTNGPMFTGTGTSPAEHYQLQSGSPARNAGRSDGTPNGSVCDIGAWGNGALRIGCNFSAGAPPEPPASVRVT